MHELGVVFYIIRDVKQTAEANNATHVQSVTLQLGEVSTVVPDMLVDCWNWAVKKEELLTGCELKIDPIPAVTCCEDCHREFPTVVHGKTCPHCGSENTYLLRGNEVMIHSIEVC